MATPSFTVRPITADDRARWVELWTGYLAFYKTELPSDVFDATWKRLMSDDSDFGGFVALDETAYPIGLTHYIVHATTWSPQPYCYLEDLYVDPATRGGGVGRALIAAVRERAEMLGCVRLYWMTQEFNYKGRMLYDQIAEKPPFVMYERML